MGQTARGLIAMVVVVGVIAGAYFLFRDRLSGAADDLRVGDCFTEPAGETISDIQHQPCTEAHDGEVYFIANADLESYPIVFGFDEWVSEHCVGVPFDSYVGQPVEERADIDIGYFAPTREGWEGGDREMTCYLTPSNGSATSQSFKAGAAPAAS
jgi:hypothetical protein